MLSIFRKYQRYIYLIVTIVIIISFSFFGTYSTLGSNTWREQVVFKAVNGDEITRSEIDEVSNFLATDNADKLAYGGAWGPNFLNDGVIKKDFLETGLAEDLLVAYSHEIKEEWLKRAEKEKKFSLYTNPKAAFIGVEQAWNYFAPDMITNYNNLKNAQDPTEASAIASRIKLYLDQNQIPPSMLKKILRYQEQQFDWLTPDYSLDNRDLSLFGYHTINDWFSSHFTTIVSQFIINAAALAESKGYQVSREEAMADLARSTQISYAENIKNPNLGVTSPQEYFNEQLRLLNMDQGAAIKVWQQVLLFRRYFQDAGQSAFVDTLAFKNFNHYASENVTADVYRLPAALRLNSNQSLQKFEIYLQAVTNTSNDSLKLPQNFAKATAIVEKYPELVQKNYVLDVAQLDAKLLQSKISIKDLWSWETEENNWNKLREKFPQLGAKEANNTAERFDILEEVTPNERVRIDSFAKHAIVESHPEWIDQALANIPAKKVEMGLRVEGDKMPFEGLDSREKRVTLMKYLDDAILGQAPEANSPLYTYTADGKTYYRITVLERSEEFKILTFAEANQDRTLDIIKDRVLEEYYLANREKNPDAYQNSDNEWKSFKSVKELVAEEYFTKTWDEIEKIKQELAKDDPIYSSMGKDQLAALRFYPYFKEVKDEISNDPSQLNKYTFVKDQANDQIQGLDQQWKLEKETITFSRENANSALDVEEAFKLTPKSWSAIRPTFSGDLVAFQVLDKGTVIENQAATVEHTRAAHAILSSAAQRSLMQGVLKELKEKNAISLAYLKTPVDSDSSEEMSVE